MVELFKRQLVSHRQEVKKGYFINSLLLNMVRMYLEACFYLLLLQYETNQYIAGSTFFLLNFNPLILSQNQINHQHLYLTYVEIITQSFKHHSSILRLNLFQSQKIKQKPFSNLINYLQLFTISFLFCYQNFMSLLLYFFTRKDFIGNVVSEYRDRFAIFVILQDLQVLKQQISIYFISIFLSKDAQILIAYHILNKTLIMRYSFSCKFCIHFLQVAAAHTKLMLHLYSLITRRNNINLIMLKKSAKIAKKFLWNIDLFASPQLLRYKNETNYSTLTGGCLSLIIIAIFGAFLIKNSISVLTMSEVVAKDSTYFLENPTYTSFKFDASSKFMIGIGIQGLDLSKPERYFDIQLFSLGVKYGTHFNVTPETLSPCKQEQWTHFEGGASSYKNLRLNQFLCPTSNITVELEGKFTSDSFRLLELRVSKCKNSTDPSRPCVSDAKVNEFPTYSLNYYFLNAYLNSGNLDPVGYYLQDRNYFGFTVDTTIVSNLYVTQNIVATDSSLFPWQDSQNDTILLIKQPAQVKQRVQIPNQYISVYLRKSPYYILSQRSFPKLQELLSTIGGLFGFALAFFFFMQFYTEASFEIEMGDKLFFYNSQTPLRSNGFNFIFFIAYLIYQLLKQVFCIQIPWQRMKIYYQCREEIKQQLDISHLMNKITFLQKCMNIVFEQHQFRAIYLQQKPSVKEAENLRKNHGLNKIIHKNSKKINTKIQQKLKFHKNKLINNIKKAKKVQRQNQLQKYLISMGSKQSGQQKQKKQAWQFQQKQNEIDQGGIQLKQIVGNFILNGLLGETEKAQKDNKMGLKISKISQIQQEKQQKQSKTYYEISQNIQAEEIAGQGHESLQFINTALRDIKQIEQQSKQGNVFSQRIYNQLNNDITKEQLIILKCLETILENKSIPSEKIQVENKTKLKASKKNSIFQSLMRLTSQSGATNNKNETDDMANNGLEIILETKNRIVTREDL